MNKFKMWMALSSTAEKKRLAKLAGTSFIYLYAIADGSRVCGSDLAGQIAEASKVLYIQTHKRLPILWRSDLSPVCAKCPYSPKCGK